MKVVIDIDEKLYKKYVHIDSGRGNGNTIVYTLLKALKKGTPLPIEDCRNCKKWDECPCGKEGHTKGTSIGYSIGECKEYEPCEETRELLTADERALFLNKLTHWLKDNFNDIVIGGWQDTDGEIFDLFFIKRERKTVKED